MSCNLKELSQNCILTRLLCNDSIVGNTFGNNGCNMFVNVGDSQFTQCVNGSGGGVCERTD